jgi:hypothetical protein
MCRYNDSQTVDEIKLALQAGFRSIDTAFDYGDEVRVTKSHVTRAHAPSHHAPSYAHPDRHRFRLIPLSTATRLTCQSHPHVCTKVHTHASTAVVLRRPCTQAPLCLRARGAMLQSAASPVLDLLGSMCICIVLISAVNCITGWGW